MSRMQRDKGARAELQVVEFMKPYWPAATRNFASGAAGNGDIANGPQGVTWEVKHTERLRLRDAWKQTERAALVRNDIPAIAMTWNRGPWLGTVELPELLTLLAFREGAL